MDGEIYELSDINWEKVIEKSKKPVIVNFFSEGCPHCKTMMPYFEKFSKEFSEKVVFGRLDIEKNVWIRDCYGIMSTPTFKYFCGGKPVGEIVGAVYPIMLKKMIEDMIEHGEECAKKSSAIEYEITGYA